MVLKCAEFNTFDNSGRQDEKNADEQNVNIFFGFI